MDQEAEFSKCHGVNIESTSNPEGKLATAQWKFVKSHGIAFSALPLTTDQYEASFDGSGHASVGFTQSDPDNISDIPRAIEENKIVFVTDVRFHKRTCKIKICKKKIGDGKFIFETRYKENAPQTKDLLPSPGVWLVIYLKFGQDIKTEFRKGTEKQYFHRKYDENVQIADDQLSIGLKCTYPLAYVSISKSVQAGDSVRLRISHIDENEKPRLYHVRIGISNNVANSVKSFDFKPTFSTKLERESCLGIVDVCLSNDNEFHIRSDVTGMLYSKNVIPEVDITAGITFCLEIFRVKVDIVKNLVCEHENQNVPAKRQSIASVLSYVSVEDFSLIESMNEIEKSIQNGVITPQDQRNLEHISEVLSNESKSFEYDDDYLTPISMRRKLSIKGQSQKRPESEAYGYVDPVSADESHYTLGTLYTQVKKNEEMIRKSHFGRQMSEDKIMALESEVSKIKEILEKVCSQIREPDEERSSYEKFQIHLRDNATQFIASVDVPSFCDYLYEGGVISSGEYEKFRETSAHRRRDAGRDLLMLLTRKQFNDKEISTIVKAFKETKLDFLLSQK